MMYRKHCRDAPYILFRNYCATRLQARGAAFSNLLIQRGKFKICLRESIETGPLVFEKTMCPAGIL